MAENDDLAKMQAINYELKQLYTNWLKKEVRNDMKQPMKEAYQQRNEILKSIPNFWLNAFLSHPKLGYRLNTVDQQIFGHLSSIEFEHRETPLPGCRSHAIIFNFDTNSFFTNEKIEKVYVFDQDEPKSAVATVIDWITDDGIPNLQRQLEGLDQNDDDLSFFNWFYDTTKPEELLVDDEFADIIKDELIPDPFKYLEQ